MSSSIGMISNPIYGKIKHVSNHQPDQCFQSLINRSQISSPWCWYIYITGWCNWLGFLCRLKSSSTMGHASGDDQQNYPWFSLTKKNDCDIDKETGTFPNPTDGLLKIDNPNPKSQSKIPIHGNQAWLSLDWRSKIGDKNPMEFLSSMLRITHQPVRFHGNPGFETWRAMEKRARQKGDSRDCRSIAIGSTHHVRIYQGLYLVVNYPRIVVVG